MAFSLSYYLFTIFKFIAFAATTSNGANAYSQINAVAGSKAVLECAHNGSLDIENVYWRSSRYDSVILYIPKDEVVIPENYDKRFTFYNNIQFSIDPLFENDTGMFNCTIISVLPKREVSFTTFLTVSEGCHMWNYEAPLKALGNGCSSGEIVLFQNECSLSCQIGFNLVGQNSSQCGGNGTMSGKLPQCEATVCNVDKLPAHLTDTNGHCMNESKVMIKEQCTFSCDRGFVIEGSKTIECQPDGTFNGIFPSCTESVRNYAYFGLFGLLVIPLAASVIWYAIRRNRDRNQARARYEYTSMDIKSRGIDDKLKSAYDYACLLNDQLKSMSQNKRNMTKWRIINILSREEMQIIKQINAIDYHAEDYPVDMSSEQAFSRYVVLIISFIEDKEYAQRVKAAILSVSVGGLDINKSLSYTSTYDQKPDASLLPEKQLQVEYCRVTNEALMNLVVAERSKMGHKERTKRTAKIAATFLSVQEKWDQASKTSSELPGLAGSTKGSDTKSYWLSSLGSSSSEKQESDEEGVTRGNASFGEMCSQTLNMCNSITATLDMKHTILKHLLFPVSGINNDGSRDKK